MSITSHDVLQKPGLMIAIAYPKSLALMLDRSIKDTAAQHAWDGSVMPTQTAPNQQFSLSMVSSTFAAPVAIPYTGLTADIHMKKDKMFPVIAINVSRHRSTHVCL